VSTTAKRLSVLYVVPGSHLVTTSGPGRNALSLAQALSQHADVTLAFRRFSDPPPEGPCRAIEIEPDGSGPGETTTDEAARGLNPLAHWRYFRRLRAFAREQAETAHVVLEKSWRFSGFVSAAFGRQAVPCAVVENHERHWCEPIRSVRAAAKRVMFGLQRRVVQHYLRRAPLIIAETDALKNALVQRSGVDPTRIEVVGLGLNHDLFRPQSSTEARRGLGISSDRRVLLYVGGFDKYHNLEPVIQALGRGGSGVFELHLVGDGEYRPHLEQLAVEVGAEVVFHGRVAHTEVPRYIAAADLGLAPYELSAFPGGELTFSTLKIPEYMACGRAAVSVPSAQTKTLINDGVNGYLIPNEIDAWTDLLDRLPPRERLLQMGQAAVKSAAPLTWEATAEAYYDICRRLADRTGCAHCKTPHGTRTDDGNL
jgi:glycosyltransferase involved in cell wall biosynthesis